MDLARYVVESVELRGLSYRKEASEPGVSKSWVAKMVTRYKAGGYEALALRSKIAHSIPHRTPVEVEDKIIRLRKQLVEQGFDAGAQTIHFHLSNEIEQSPSVTTIWRILRR